MTKLQSTHKTTFVQVAGKKIQMTRGGSGPPLVYLHSAATETDWTSFHEALAEHFTVYAPVHPGFALSSGLDQIKDMSDMVWHYVDWFEQVGLQRVPVVGFSLGAWIAVELAILRPELVDRLVMVAAIGLHVDGAPMAELFVHDLETLRKLIFLDPTSPIVDQIVPTNVDDERMLLWIRAREVTARVGWNPYLHNPKLPGRLHRVKCPTRVIWGRQDALIPLAHGEAYAERIPNAQLRIIEDCGHMVPFEKQDEFIALTTSFLQADTR